MVAGIGVHQWAEIVIVEIDHLLEGCRLQALKFLSCQHVDSIVGGSLWEPVQRSLGVYVGQHWGRDDGQVELADLVLVLLEDLQQLLRLNLLRLDVLHELLLFEMAKLQPALEPEIDGVVAVQKYLLLVLSDVLEQVEIL